MPRAGGDVSTTTAASKARISLRADIDKLMDCFLQTESVRYQEFARSWQALNFALIYVGLKDTKDKKEFIQDAFELVSEYLQPPFDLQRRVCALYTLYGLYYTQTHHPRIKIRMSLEDWKETLALHDDLQEQGHLDALYVFHKMRLDKAFMFTQTHAPMFYQGRAKKPEDFERWAAKHQSFMASVLDEDLLRELEQVHTEYQSGKQVAEVRDDPSLAIVKDSMSDYIMERISNIDVPMVTDSETEALADSRSRAIRIREIKKRSFASPTQMSKARRSRSQYTDDSGTDDPTYNPTIPRSRRKGKRKGRGRSKKSDSDTSFSSPTRKKRKGPSDLNLTPENVDQKSERQKKGRPKKSPSKSAGDEAARTPNETMDVVTPKTGGSSSKKKRAPKKAKDALKTKNKSSSLVEEEGESSVKKKKQKKKSLTTEQAEQPKSGKNKRGNSKKKVQSPTMARVRPLRSSSKKLSSSSSGARRIPKVKVESKPHEGQQEVNLSPRKRPRKSSSPRRLMQDSGKKT